MQAQKRSRGDSRARIDAAEAGDRFEYVLFGAATPGWHTVEERRRRVADAELIRTLYVAMTRARDRLVVAGVFPVDSHPRRARARTHMDLVSQRETPEGGLAALAATVRRGGGSHGDGAGARWVFPALELASAAPEAPGGTFELPSPAEVSRQAELLARLRRDAATHEARAFSLPASLEAHRLLRESLIERSDEEGAMPAPASGERAGRTAAAAAGVAVHRILETLDLGGDLRAQISSAQRGLPEMLDGLIGPDDKPEALARGRDVLERLASGPLLARLETIGPSVVARELPVMLPPGDGPGAPVGFVSGTIDLVYRDPATGALVIADYKTDEAMTDLEVAGRVAAYAPQGTTYRRALTEALHLDAEPRFELWFLHPGRIETAG
jgi:ATP-dependent exoDNAse (exonuclease V) beta subunit